MNEDIDGNRKLFLKIMSRMNRGKLKSCSRIKDGNGSLALGQIEYKGFGIIILRIYIFKSRL